jgi:hypothetical protein
MVKIRAVKLSDTLLHKITIYNKRWSKYLIPYLESSETTDLPRETTRQGLHIGLCARCIVGEAYGFTMDYSEYDGEYHCNRCYMYSEDMCAVYHNIISTTLKSLLWSFYRHLEHDHVNIINKIIIKVN